MSGSRDDRAPAPEPAGHVPADPEVMESEVFDFLGLFMADRAQGDLHPLEHYLPRFPGHEAAITAEFRRVESEAVDALPGTTSFGPYRIIEQLGRGGQGTVMLAEDTRLHRRVALKLLAPHLDFISTERLQRFRREVEILSQLDHPGICSVFEADTCERVPYLAMHFVEGRTLAAILRSRRDAGELPRTRAELHRVMLWIEAAARALHEAHEAGVVHRDVKPGNLMITPQDQPVLLDFGLARQEEHGDVSITQTGAVLGTLAYMAPELLASRSATADRRVDVYALGATLYECLTGRLPFAGDSQGEVWHAIQTLEPLDPRAHNPAIPRELSAVVLTALEKSPARRYRSALDLADDLARVRARKPIRARSIPAHVRAVRVLQRHPTLAFAVGALILVLVVLAVSLERVSANERTASALNRTLHATASDEGAAAALAELVAAAGSDPNADLQSAILQVLDGCHLAWRRERFVGSVRTGAQPAVDPDSRFVALGDLEGQLSMYDSASGASLGTRRAHDGAVRAITFVNGGSSLVTAGNDGRIRMWSVPGLQELAHPDTSSIASKSPVGSLALSPDGGLLAIGGQGFVRLLHTGSLAQVATIDIEPEREATQPPTLVPSRLQFSPRGDQLLVLASETTPDPNAFDRCRVVSVPEGETLHEFPPYYEALLWAEWHPTRTALACAWNGGLVRVIDSSTWQTVFEVKVGQEVNWCGFDPTGELLLVPTDRCTQIWRWRNRAREPERLLPHPHMRTIGAAEWSPDGKQLAAVHRDGTVIVYAGDWSVFRSFKQRTVDARFLHWLADGAMLLTGDMKKLSAWHAGIRPHLPHLRGHAQAVASVTVHPDGRRVLTASQDGAARLWSLDRCEPLAELSHEGVPLRRARFSAGGERILTLGDGADLFLWNTDTGAREGALKEHSESVVDAWFTGDGRVVSIGEDGRTIRWDTDSMQPLHVLLDNAAPLRSAAFHPTRPWIAVGGADCWVSVWNLETGERVQQLRAIDYDGDWRVNPMHQVRGLCFEAHSDRLLASLVNSMLVTWTSGDWKREGIHGERFGGAMLFDPSTRGVVCADFSFGHVSIIHGSTLTPIEVEGRSPHANRISALKLHPRGGMALSAGQDGQVWIWDLTTRERVLGLRCAGAILDADFSPDGKWVITGAADGTVKLWPLDPVAMAREYLAQRARSSR